LVIRNIGTGKKSCRERVHACKNWGHATDRDVAAAQVVLIKALAALGQDGEHVWCYRSGALVRAGKFIGIPLK
jgi:putative transposase